MIDIVKLQEQCSALSILYVEDDKVLHTSMISYLKKLFKHIDSAYNGKDGLDKYKSGMYDIVISDIKMPKLNGLEMISAIKDINPDQETIILSAHTESEYFLEAIHLGVSDYIVKPISFKQINSVLYKVSSRLEVALENKRYKENLENIVIEKTRLLVSNYEQTLDSMIKMIEGRDSYTAGHSSRVAKYSKAIAVDMGLSDDECSLIYHACILHDIGKITTPDKILLKPGQLSDMEYNLIKDHVTVSYNILSQIPMYSDMAEIIYCHHEHYDGSGYPRGLKGDEIPILSHIMIIADAFDAMTTNRIYKGRKGIEEAIQEIENLSEKQFHPKVVSYARKALENIEIEYDITQLPKNSMENERFAYFFLDSVTEAYNKDYLDFFLQHNYKENIFKASICFFRNFTQYNNKFGWDKGDVMLKKFSGYLKDIYPKAMVFRIHGDDFILLVDDPEYDFLHEDIQPSFLDDTGINVECHILPEIDDINKEIQRISMKV